MSFTLHLYGDLNTRLSIFVKSNNLFTLLDKPPIPGHSDIDSDSDSDILFDITHGNL